MKKDKTVKHLINTEDLTKEEYLEIFRRAELFEENPQMAVDLCRGKVLASMFFKESTRTSAVSRSAMIRLGGGWIGINGIQGSYLGTGEEDLEDYLSCFINYADIMVIRHNDLDLNQWRDKFKIPVINGMCAGDDLAISALIYPYCLSKKFKKLDNMKVGIYGQTKNCRPYKTVQKALSFWGAQVYEDPVVDELATPQGIIDFVNSHGGRYERAKLSEFIDKVDVLFICDGMPSHKEDPRLMEEYNKKFQTVMLKDLERLRKDAMFQYMMPRAMTDGRLTVAKEVDTDPRLGNEQLLKDWLWVLMAAYTYLLDLEV